MSGRAESNPFACPIRKPHGVTARPSRQSATAQHMCWIAHALNFSAAGDCPSGKRARARTLLGMVQDRNHPVHKSRGWVRGREGERRSTSDSDPHSSVYHTTHFDARRTCTPSYAHAPRRRPRPRPRQLKTTSPVTLALAWGSGRTPTPTPIQCDGCVLALPPSRNASPTTATAPPMPECVIKGTYVACLASRSSGETTTQRPWISRPPFPQADPRRCHPKRQPGDRESQPSAPPPPSR